MQINTVLHIYGATPTEAQQPLAASRISNNTFPKDSSTFSRGKSTHSPIRHKSLERDQSIETTLKHQGSGGALGLVAACAYSQATLSRGLDIYPVSPKCARTIET